MKPKAVATALRASDKDTGMEIKERGADRPWDAADAYE